MEAMIQAGLSDIKAHCVSPKGGPEWLHCHVLSTKSKETLPIYLLSSAYTCFDRTGHALQEWPLICVAIYSKLSNGECSRLCLEEGEHISSQWPCLCKATQCSGFLRPQATVRRNLHAKRQASPWLTTSPGRSELLMMSAMVPINGDGAEWIWIQGSQS